ncbi:MAG: tetratricopeptide repeat protein, partial [Polyangia bacterium]
GELPAAAVTLGGMLLFDPESAPEGISWLRRAAKSGEPSAFWLLGAAHLRGLGVAVDAQQARVLLAAAAEAGVTEAQLELARLYVEGVGGARDDAAAARWEQAAAHGGSADGCVRVAERLLSRGGNLALAIPWLERAAEAGSAAAAARLAHFYLMGAEVPYDAALAERWMERARALGWSWEPV